MFGKQYEHYMLGVRPNGNWSLERNLGVNPVLEARTSEELAKLINEKWDDLSPGGIYYADPYMNDSRALTREEKEKFSSLLKA